LPRATQTQPQVPSLSSLAPLHLLCNLSHIIPNFICSHASHKTILFIIYSSTSTFGSLVTTPGAHYFIVAKGPGLYTVAICITVQSNEDEDRIVQHQARQNQRILCLSLRNTSARVQLFFDHQSTSNQRLEEHADLRRVSSLLHSPLCHELSYFLRFSLRHCLIQSHPKQSRTSSAIQLQFQSGLFCLVLTKHPISTASDSDSPQRSLRLTTRLPISSTDKSSLHQIRYVTTQILRFVHLYAQGALKIIFHFANTTRPRHSAQR